MLSSYTHRTGKHLLWIAAVIWIHYYTFACCYFPKCSICVCVCVWRKLTSKQLGWIGKLWENEISTRTLIHKHTHNEAIHWYADGNFEGLNVGKQVCAARVSDKTTIHSHSQPIKYTWTNSMWMQFRVCMFMCAVCLRM